MPSETRVGPGGPGVRSGSKRFLRWLRVGPKVPTRLGRTLSSGVVEGQYLTTCSPKTVGWDCRNFYKKDRELMTPWCQGADRQKHDPTRTETDIDSQDKTGDPCSGPVGDTRGARPVRRDWEGRAGDRNDISTGTCGGRVGPPVVTHLCQDPPHPPW